MNSSPLVTAVAFAPARDIDVQLGLLGFVTCNVDSIRIDSIALRRTTDGRRCLRFPTKKKGARGREFQIVWPANEAARVAIEQQIFAALEMQGVLP